MFRRLAIARRNAHGKCDTSQNALPVGYQQIIDAHGPIRL